MTVIRNFWILVVLILPWTFERGDAVLCTFMESCILPCTFQPGNHVLIHWIKQTDIAVHSYYRDKDQLANQHQQFRGRTTLFTDQFQNGNASLRLTAVKLSDQGSYKCYSSTTSGNKDSAVDLNVEAPPREVSIEQEGNMITCSSEGLYPEPTITWTSSPSVTLAPDIPTMERTQQDLYNARSSLVVSQSDVDYTCTVNTGRSSKTATLHKPTSVSTSRTETTLPCISSNVPSKSLVWRFNNNQSILSRTSSEDSVTASEWEKYVKSVSESGSLTLRHLTSNQAGTYTCELSTAEQKHIRSTELTITKSQAAGIAVGVIVAILIVAVVVTLLICRKRVSELFKKEKKSGDNGTETVHQEETPLKSNGERTETSPKTENEKMEV